MTRTIGKDFPMIGRLAFAAVVLSGYAGSAEAACRTAGGNFFINQNDTVTYYSTSDNGKCGHGYTAGAGTTFSSAEVIRPPSNGTLKKTGAFRFSYAARAGFKGQDTYTIRVCGTSQGRDGCSTLNYQLTVQ